VQGVLWDFSNCGAKVVHSDLQKRKNQHNYLFSNDLQEILKGDYSAKQVVFHTLNWTHNLSFSESWDTQKITK